MPTCAPICKEAPAAVEQVQVLGIPGLGLLPVLNLQSKQPDSQTSSQVPQHGDGVVRLLRFLVLSRGLEPSLQTRYPLNPSDPTVYARECHYNCSVCAKYSCSWRDVIIRKR